MNEHVIANHPLHIFVTSRDHARELGAMMLFGEKYGDHVRVVEVPEVSRELCGGTHVRSTAEIGPFVVTRETSSVAGDPPDRGDHGRRRAGPPPGEAARGAGAAGARVRARGRGQAGRPGGAAGTPSNGSVAGLIDGASEEAGVRIVAAVVADADADQLLQHVRPHPLEAVARRGRAGRRRRAGRHTSWRASTAARRSAGSRRWT